MSFRRFSPGGRAASSPRHLHLHSEFLPVERRFDSPAKISQRQLSLTLVRLIGGLLRISLAGRSLEIGKFIRVFQSIRGCMSLGRWQDMLRLDLSAGFSSPLDVTLIMVKSSNQCCFGLGPCSPGFVGGFWVISIFIQSVDATQSNAVGSRETNSPPSL